MKETPAFEFSGKGMFSAGEKDYEAELSVVVTSTGQVRGEAILPLSKESAGDLLRVTSSNEVVVPFFGLRVDTDEGVSISSDHLFLTSTRTLGGQEGSRLQVEFHARRIDLFWNVSGSDHPEPEIIEYLVPGALGFGGDNVSSPYGDVLYAAPASIEEEEEEGENHWFGRLVLRCVPGTIEEEREAYVTRLLEILSFGQGTELQWVVRKEVAGGAVRTMRIEPSSRFPQPGFPVFSHLNLQLVLELATTAYTEEVREKSGLRVAMTWLLLRPRYREAEYLMGMTALEHLISKSSSTAKGSRIPKSTFEKKVKSPLVKALAKVKGIETEDRNFFEKKIANLNNRPFADRMMDILEAEGVPVADIKESIPTLVTVRNRIVHTGEARNGEEDRSSLIFPLTVLRELIVRIILHRLNFKGQYYCRLKEVSWGSFPPEV